MKDVFICGAIRTPIGKYGGGLSSVRTDDLACIPIKGLISENKDIPPDAIDDVIIGCSNQSGEDNRNVARMAVLLSGLSYTVPAVTVNRLCGSGMEAVAMAFRAIKSKDATLIIAGGVESMSRAPFVINKSEEPFSRNIKIYDTTIGWRFVNEKLAQMYGVDSMIETAENIASEYSISREEQDKYAYASQLKASEAQKQGYFKEEIVPVTISQKKSQPVIFDTDEHLRLSSLEQLSELKPVVKNDGTVTAGNASGINDGAAALLISSNTVIKRYNLKPLARIVAVQTIGVEPRIMGIGPVSATNKLLIKTALSLNDIDIIELNEAFASQTLACIRTLGLEDDDPRINPQGGAIALGHPLGMSGARLIITAIHQLQRKKLKRALCTMCIGVGQGIAMIIENA